MQTSSDLIERWGKDFTMLYRIELECDDLRSLGNALVNLDCDQLTVMDLVVKAKSHGRFTIPTFICEADIATMLDLPRVGLWQTVQRYALTADCKSIK